MTTQLRSNMTKIFYTLVAFVLTAPALAFAQNNNSGNASGGNNNSGNASGGGNGGSAGGGDSLEFTLLQNPLQAAGIENIPQFVETILNIALQIGVPLIALAIIYSGFLFVAAQGNPDKLKKARQAFLWTMVGAAVLLAAVAIAQAIGGTIEQLRG
jgi:hypothetical protein